MRDCEVYRTGDWELSEYNGDLDVEELIDVDEVDLEVTLVVGRITAVGEGWLYQVTVEY